MKNTIGNFAPDFEIPGIDKEVYHLGSYRQKYKAIAVVFMDNNSLEVQQYIARLKQIQADFGGQDFTIMGINSNIVDTMESMKQYAQEQELNFPYLRDTTQDVAKSFKVLLTPTVYLLDSGAIIRYQGSIDDCAESADQVNNNYLRDSVAAMIANQNVPKNYAEPVGTSIKWRES